MLLCDIMSFELCSPTQEALLCTPFRTDRKTTNGCYLMLRVDDGSEADNDTQTSPAFQHISTRCPLNILPVTFGRRWVVLSRQNDYIIALPRKIA